ncbi:MAG: ArsR family transcriptional regulator [Patescibacteria group bacterium]
MIKQILIKTVEQQVLAHLLKNAGDFLYNREMARDIGVNESACSMALKKLYAHKLLLKKEIGRNILYAINENSAYVQMLKSYVGALDVELLVNALQKDSKLIILFGSVAKGLYNISQESDMDLLIVTNHKKAVEKIISTFISSREYFFTPKTILRTEAEYIKMSEKDKIFFNEINRGIVLWKKNYDQRI